MSLTDFYEFGVLEADSFIRFMEDQTYRHGFGFDSFVGLPSEQSGLIHSPRETEGVYSLVKGQNEVKTNKTYQTLTQAIKAVEKTITNSGVTNFTLIKKFYADLTDKDVIDYDMRPAKLIHMDCDLYISTKQALEFMITNNLIQVGTEIIYDDWDQYKQLGYNEFESGQSKAHKEISDKYNIKWTGNPRLFRCKSRDYFMVTTLEQKFRVNEQIRGTDLNRGRGS